ncbi:DUF560 domain-containing protein [Brenneria goodwinii]|uniref:surface lipoprotein assembly modifier n=2 Tax=Brenneria goodwinii TaxID=1109412 RepID=UPI000EF29322|nr:surface lipoprotein assembly modifier [Brenneria goodwinii]MCG8156455.1 DUF560 domain-containing protein [Brenneria goodwinii]MCG8162174.1 DUF560 domain-containing protein [Brenneria goodwinii]MCG8166784.1 DUF560 domain-containing protein [Brenneria goodwinii]MCG8171434.1 DUF560 domain-containing protein [Brenneria goodwinii]MCG8175144.1 DUF560 domain-containing protein [Brenneria goodwinii]
MQSERCRYFRNALEINMIKGYLWIFAPLLAVVPGATAAADAPAVPRPPVPEQNRNFNLTDDPLNRRESPSWLEPQTQQQKKVINLSEQDLLARPELLSRMMMVSLLKQDIRAIRVLYPIYIRLPGHDPLMARYAEGEIARDDGDFGTAIEKYRAILDQDETLSMVRFSMAIALYVDNQLGPARREFATLAQDSQTPEGFRQTIAMFQAGIDRQTGWKMDASVSYVSDPNVNNAPDQRYIDTAYGRWTLPARQSAHGVKYYAGLRRDTPIDGHFYWRNQAYVFGKSYWDNHDYDDVYGRLTSGIAWRSARHDLSLMPFFAHRWFGTEPYSQTVGARAQENYFINRDWQIISALEYGRLTYDSRTYLDGYSLSASFSVVHRLSDRQYLVLGADAGKQTARDRSDAYDYYGARLAHVFVWPLNITSQTEIGVVRREYQALNFFNVVQSDQDYTASLTLWKNDWSWQGFTPRLTFDYRKVNSNYVMAEYSKKQIGIEIKKEF